MSVPVILSEPSHISVMLGQDIRLPCTVDRLPDALQILWSKVSPLPHMLVAMGKRVLYDRAMVEHSETGSALLISSARLEDAGEYRCSIAVAGDDPPEIVHIVTVTEEEVISAKEGDDVSLSCPPPLLSWTRPDGEERIAGERMTLYAVRAKDAGIYTCTADNGQDKPVSHRILLNIDYRPSVRLEEVFVHTAGGRKVELVCTVQGYPHPDTLWRKDGEVIRTNDDRIKTHHHGQIHSLSIQDHGSYSCHATNYLGSATATHEISGKASPAVFKSSPRGTKDTAYLLEWSTMSFSPITEFQLETRLVGSSEWNSSSVSPLPGEELYHSAGKHYLTRLAPATHYQARVRAVTREGASPWGEPFTFSTRGAGRHLAFPVFISVLLYTILYLFTLSIF